MGVSILFADNIDLNKLASEAKKSHKHILVFLHITDCPHCIKMEEFTFDDSKVKQMIKKHFLFVNINVRDDGNVSWLTFKGNKMNFAKHIGYDMYPSSIFLDENAKVVFDEIGYRDEVKYLKTLQFVSNKMYNDID
jgi:thioredoxin-related protein